MSKKKYNLKNTESESLKDPLASYRNSKIVFSTLETQGDILLKNNFDKSPAELLVLMNQLNAYAFKNLSGEKLNFKNAHLIFSSYEYIP
jgi:hypothetical protein